MKRTILALLALSLGCLAAPSPLQETTVLGSFALEESATSRTFQLPALKQRPGMTPVLRCRMFIRGKHASGCNYGARITFNGTLLSGKTASGRDRILDRRSRFELKDPHYPGLRPVIRGTDILLIFAPNANAADGVIKEENGSWFCFDISDLNRDVDCNTVTFQNTRPKDATDRCVVIQDAEFGYRVNKSDDANLRTASYTPSNLFIENASYRLDLYPGGGFALSNREGGVPMIIETSFGMKPLSPALLTAGKVPADRKAPRLSRLSNDTLRMETQFGTLRLERTLRLMEDRLEWKEKWTNRGKGIQGVPFRHQCFLADELPRIWLRGEPDTADQLTLDGNATVFLESRKHSGIGTGIVLEDDILRLIAGAMVEQGVAEIYSGTLAMAPGSSRTFTYTLNPVAEGGYWTFINAVRDRWGAGRFGAERPVFWGPHLRYGTSEEGIWRELGHLGPIAVSIPEWLPHYGDKALLRSNSSVTPQELLQHRQKKIQEFLTELLPRFKRALPEARILTMTHPMMFYAYLPEFENTRLAADAIRTPDGKPYRHDGFEQIILRDAVKRGWFIPYLLPRPGGYAFETHLAITNAVLDAGADGVYCDEFSSCNERRSYSRYDYSEWDGFSADLDENGKVLRLKSDCGYTSLPFQNAMLHAILSRGKYFLGNGPTVSRDILASAAHRFSEGASSHANMAAGHLNHVPLVLGNFGDLNSTAGVMAAVREALLAGCVYSPFSTTHFHVQGPDNFVCKLYPLTIVRLGPGTIWGRERIITCVSGKFRLPENVTSPRLYVYDKNGVRLQTPVPRGPEMELKVPEGGLVIVEWNTPAP